MNELMKTTDSRVTHICMSHGVTTLRELANSWSYVCKLPGFGRKSERVAREALRHAGYIVPTMYSVEMDVGTRYPVRRIGLTFAEVFETLREYNPIKAKVRLW